MAKATIPTALSEFVTQQFPVGARRTRPMLSVCAGLSIGDVLEQASAHLSALVGIVEDAAMSNPDAPELYGALMLGEVAKALIDAATIAVGGAEIAEASHG